MASRIGRKGQLQRTLGELQRTSENQMYRLLPKRIQGVVQSVVGGEGTAELAQGGHEVGGITFVVTVPSMPEPLRVRCGVPYDILRTCFGTDDNLINRKCTVEYIGEGYNAMCAGRVTFDVYPNAMYANENKAGGSLVTIGSFNGCGVDVAPENFDEPSDEYNGEEI